MDSALLCHLLVHCNTEALSVLAARGATYIFNKSQGFYSQLPTGTTGCDLSDEQKAEALGVPYRASMRWNSLHDCIVASCQKLSDLELAVPRFADDFYIKCSLPSIVAADIQSGA